MQVVEINAQSKTFDNYEVMWHEENQEIDLKYRLQTTYDFNEANENLQKAINKMKKVESQSQSTRQQSDFDDDFGASNNDFEDDWGNEQSSTGQRSNQVS